MKLPSPAQLSAYAVDAKKFLVAVLGVIVMLLDTGMVHGTTEHWLSVIISIAVAAGVFTVRNGKKPKDIND